MGKQSKPKSGQENNDNRPNGRANKKHPGRRHHGSKSSRLDEGTLVLLGKGLYVKYERMNAEGARQIAGKKNKKGPKSDS